MIGCKTVIFYIIDRVTIVVGYIVLISLINQNK